MHRAVLACLLCCLCARGACAAISDQLVLHLPLDGDLRDASPSAVSPSAFGTPEFGPGLIGQALTLRNGDDSPPQAGAQFVDLGTQAELVVGPKSDFSVGLWVKTTDYVNGNDLGDSPLIGNKDWSGFSNPGWILAGTGADGRWQWNLDTLGAPPVRFPSPDQPVELAPINDGAWHHLLVSHDRDGEAVFYQDGERVGAVLIATHAMSTVGVGFPTVVGADGRFGSTWKSYFNGSFDDLLFWRRVVEPTEVTKIFGGGLQGVDAQAADQLEFVSLRVNTTTGEIRLRGGELTSVIDSYEIRSPAASLLPQSWLEANLAAQSLDAVDGGDDPGETWEVLEASASQLFEAFLLGSSSFSEDRVVSLGMAYNTQIAANDLQFTFTTAGGTQIQGSVQYVHHFDGSDFNGDGVVDGGDFLRWQANFGTLTGALAAMGDGDGDGDVDSADYLTWQSSLTIAAAPLGTWTPEPRSWLLICWAALGSLVRLRIVRPDRSRQSFCFAYLPRNPALGRKANDG